MFWITSGIGLIHGLGFSFVLQNVLKVTSPNIWQSLLAFNLGIELGQLAIVIVAAGLFVVVRKMSAAGEVYTRTAVAGVCGLAGIYWVLERGASFFV